MGARGHKTGHTRRRGGNMNQRVGTNVRALREKTETPRRESYVALAHNQKQSARTPTRQKTQKLKSGERKMPNM